MAGCLVGEGSILGLRPLRLTVSREAFQAHQTALKSFQAKGVRVCRRQHVPIQPASDAKKLLDGGN